jgi:peptidoglycan/xylan/chitin deacetylase (PgdA/CDA1 family)
VPQVYAELGEDLEWFSDTYADDVPYWSDLPRERSLAASESRGLLMLPYTFDCNDFKFQAAGNGFAGPDDFLTYMKNAFNVLYEEGEEGAPKMMTIGLHCRIIGRPGRFNALKKFVEYISQKEGVWVATRTEIARSFRDQYPYRRGFLA